MPFTLAADRSRAVFWITAIPVDDADPIPVRVLVPGDPARVLGPLAQAMADHGAEIARLCLNPSDLTPDPWLARDLDATVAEPMTEPGLGEMLNSLSQVDDLFPLIIGFNVIKLRLHLWANWL